MASASALARTFGASVHASVLGSPRTRLEPSSPTSCPAFCKSAPVGQAPLRSHAAALSTAVSISSVSSRVRSRPTTQYQQQAFSSIWTGRSLSSNGQRELARWQTCGGITGVTEGSGRVERRGRVSVRAGLAVAGSGAQLPSGLHPITSEEQMDEILAAAEERGAGVVIDWMALWCRKCIYLKPKIEKIALDYPSMQFCFVDVNAVPSSLVKRANVLSMPTIQLWKDKKWHAEVIGGHKPALVLDEIREMLNQATSASS